MGEQIDFLICNICQGLKHLIVYLCLFHSVFFHIAFAGTAMISFEIIFIGVPGIIIFPHFKLAFRKDDLDIFFYHIMLFTIDILYNGRAVVPVNEFSEIKHA